jgi:hypothetical protein
MSSRAKWLSLAIALGIGVHLIFHVALGWSMFAFLVGWPVFGLIVTIDDDLPGGWSNPDGKTSPPWTYREFWGDFLLRAALSGFGFAMDALPGWQSAALWSASSLAGVAAAVAIIRSGTYGGAANDG